MKRMTMEQAQRVIDNEVEKLEKLANPSQLGILWAIQYQTRCEAVTKALPPAQRRTWDNWPLSRKIAFIDHLQAKGAFKKR